MRYYVSGSTATLRALLPRFACSLGFLMTPRNRNAVGTVSAMGIPWAIDNGAYSGFDAVAFTSLLNRAYQDAARDPEWVVCPDVVADARATNELFEEWVPRISEYRFQLAYVLQDGAESVPLPWDRMSCLFVGGSTEFKLSEAAADVALEARRRGKLVHVGRVNSYKRMTTSILMGAHSVDGSSAARWGDKYIHRYAKFLKRQSQQPALGF